MTTETLPAGLDELVALARRPHLVVDGDCWFSCPKAPSDWRDGSASCNEEEVARGECNCGADLHNAKVDAFLAAWPDTARDLGQQLITKGGPIDRGIERRIERGG